MTLKFSCCLCFFLPLYGYDNRYAYIKAHFLPFLCIIMWVGTVGCPTSLLMCGLSHVVKGQSWSLIEPCHEIMVLFVLSKLILQTHMRSHPVGLNVYFHASCVRTTEALMRLRGYGGSPEPSLVACVVSTIISRAGSVAVSQCRFNPTQTTCEKALFCLPGGSIMA